MENLKIKVNNADESKQAQEWLFELGYAWNGGQTRDILNTDHAFLFAHADSDITCSTDENIFNTRYHKEITLPQLKDMVILHRNDVNDAQFQNDYSQKAVLIENEYYFWNYQDGKWGSYKNSSSKQTWINSLKPIQKPQPENENLISGEQAKKAWANGENVLFRDCPDSLYEDWTKLAGKKGGFTIDDFDCGYEFCIKPRTILINDMECPEWVDIVCDYTNNEVKIKFKDGASANHGYQILSNIFGGTGDE